MKRNYFVLVFLLVFGLSGFAQLSFENVDQRVIDLYGETRVKEMLASQPEFIEYLNYYVKNSYQIMYNVPERKLVNFDDVSSIVNNRTGVAVNANDINNLNILLLSVVRGQDEYLTYKVGDTGTVIVFIAPSVLVTQYNELTANKEVVK